MLRMVSKNEISDAYVMPVGSGDTASGSIYLVYDTEPETVFEIKYDTVVGPDGLHIKVKMNSVRDGDGGQKINASSLPKFVEKHANKTLNQYYNEVKTGKGAHRDGSVTFAGIVGANDGWTPEK